MNRAKRSDGFREMLCATLSRRNFLSALIAAIAGRGAPAFGEDRRPRDNGLGGTGYAPTPRDPDNGLGGTGVVGTIRGFGSIILNGVRVAYPADAVVTIDGVAAQAAQMKIGHVASLVASRRGDELASGRIDILHEVVGPVEALSGRRMRVLGQTVELGRAHGARGVSPGQSVAVSGLRTPDGRIVASLVERAAPDAAQIVGVATRGADGELAIGAQRLSGVSDAAEGLRIVAQGAVAGEAFEVQSYAEAPWLPQGPRHFLVETYVARNGEQITSASGVAFVAGGGSLPSGLSRAVLSADLAANGELRIDAVHGRERGGAIGDAPPRGGVPGPGGGAPQAPGGPAGRGGFGAPPNGGVGGNGPSGGVGSTPPGGFGGTPPGGFGGFGGARPGPGGGGAHGR